MTELEPCAFIFDYTASATSQDAVHEFILASSLVTRWWNFIPGCYLIATSDYRKLKNSVDEQNFRYICFKLISKSVRGRLPEAAWVELTERTFPGMWDQITSGVRAETTVETTDGDHSS